MTAPPPPYAPQSGKGSPNARQDAEAEKAARPFYKEKRFILLGVFAIFALIIVAAINSGSGNAGTSSAPAASAVSAPVVPLPINAPPAADTASAGQAAQTACTAFSSGVDPLIATAVQSGDLAQAIRVSHGTPANDSTGSVSQSAPWPTMQNAAIDAVSADPKYQPLVDAVHALYASILHADPGGDLSAISAAEHGITRQCQALHAL